MTTTLLEFPPMSKAMAALCHAMAAAFACLVITPPFVMLVDRREPIKIEYGELTPAKVKPGDVMVVQWKVTEYRNCAGEVHRRFIDSAGVIHESVRVPTVYHEAMNRTTRAFQQNFTIPLGMHTGVATYQPIVRRWCNVIQEMVWPIVSSPPPLKFEVIN